MTMYKFGLNEALQFNTHLLIWSLIIYLMFSNVEFMVRFYFWANNLIKKLEAKNEELKIEAKKRKDYKEAKKNKLK